MVNVAFAVAKAMANAAQPSHKASAGTAVDQLRPPSLKLWRTGMKVIVEIDGECSSVGRAPDCGSGGRGFDPHHSPHYFFKKY